jgi:hypothetical protein
MSKQGIFSFLLTLYLKPFYEASSVAFVPKLKASGLV